MRRINVHISSTLIWLMLSGLSSVNAALPIVDLGAQELALSNADKAFEHWTLSAFEGDADAQFNLALLYSQGKGADVDLEQAAYWYQQAADQGHIKASYNLGHVYLEGEGINSDVNKAIHYWRQAANLNYAPAQYNMGRAYYLGIGVTANNHRARSWFERAAKQGDTRSQQVLANFRSRSQPTAAAISVVDKQKPKTAPAKTKPELIDDRLLVISEQATVHLSPNPSAIVLKTLKRSTPVKRISTTGNSSKVQIPGGLALWIHSRYIDDNGQVTGNGIRVRIHPGTDESASAIGQVNRNDRLTVIDQRGDWKQVLAPARITGWIRNDQLGPAAADPSSWQATWVEHAKTATIELKIHDQHQIEITADNSSLHNVENDFVWLFAQPGANYTVQVGGYDQQIDAQQAITRINPSIESKYYLTRPVDNDWFTVIVGSFAERNDAEQLAKQLSFKSPWIRNVGVLQLIQCRNLDKLPTELIPRLAPHCAKFADLLNITETDGQS